jgi:inorganic pyrophosphatase
MMQRSIWIGRIVEVTIDRPLGSRHPEHGFIYLVNYGYVPGTIAPDGEPQDAYVLNVDVPIASFRGVCIAEIVRHDDIETKLVVVREGEMLDDNEILGCVAFQECIEHVHILR